MLRLLEQKHVHPAEAGRGREAISKRSENILKPRNLLAKSRCRPQVKQLRPSFSPCLTLRKSTGLVERP